MPSDPEFPDLARAQKLLADLQPLGQALVALPALLAAFPRGQRQVAALERKIQELRPVAAQLETEVAAARQAAQNELARIAAEVSRVQADLDEQRAALVIERAKAEDAVQRAEAEADAGIAAGRTRQDEVLARLARERDEAEQEARRRPSAVIAQLEQEIRDLTRARDEIRADVQRLEATVARVRQ